MKTAKLDDMVRGWFIGNFESSLYKTNQCEVAVKRYHAGEREKKHFHKIATEFTVVISGSIKMNGVNYQAGDIVVMEPNDTADFYALTDAVNVVVKLPGANDDKYVVEEE